MKPSGSSAPFYYFMIWSYFRTYPTVRTVQQAPIIEAMRMIKNFFHFESDWTIRLLFSNENASLHPRLTLPFIILLIIHSFVTVNTQFMNKVVVVYK